MPVHSTPRTRNRVYARFQAGQKGTEIASIEAIPISLVYGIIRRFPKQKDGTTTNRGAPPKKLSDRDKRRISRIVANKPSISAQSIVNEARLPVSGATVSRYLKSINAVPNRAAQRPVLTAKRPVLAPEQAEDTPTQTHTMATANNVTPSSHTTTQTPAMADTAAPPHPRVGVAAVVQARDGRYLLGRRLGAHGAGTWQFPGGHLEFGEDAFACARRETREEAGLAVQPVGLLGATNDVFAAEHKHYVTLFVLCRREDEAQQPQNLEPTKCAGWTWTDWASIASLAAKGPDAADGLFLPIVNLTKQLAQPPWVALDAA